MIIQSIILENLIVENNIQVGGGRDLKKQTNSAGGECPGDEDDFQDLLGPILTNPAWL